MLTRPYDETKGCMEKQKESHVDYNLLEIKYGLVNRYRGRTKIRRDQERSTTRVIMMRMKNNGGERREEGALVIYH